MAKNVITALITENCNKAQTHTALATNGIKTFHAPFHKPNGSAQVEAYKATAMAT